MLAICSALEILPASTYAGSPPTQLNRMKTSTMTPRIVGIICHSRRMMYAYIAHLHRGRATATRITALSPRRRSVTFARARVATASAASRPDVDVLPLGVQDGMLLVPEHLRLHDLVAVTADVEPPRGIGLDDLRHLVIELVALGRRRREPDGLFVELVVLGDLRAGVVVLMDILAVEQLHEVVGIGIVGDPRGRTHHDLAFLFRLDLIREPQLLNLHPDPEQRKRLGPELVLLSAQGIRTRCVLDDQGLAVGQRSEAIGALLVAEAV